MTLFLNNNDVKSLLTMKITMEALGKSYAQMIDGRRDIFDRLEDTVIPFKVINKRDHCIKNPTFRHRSRMTPHPFLIPKGWEESKR